VGALMAAVAVVSALIGGGTATLVEKTTGTTTTAAAAPVVKNASATSSGVAAIAKAVSPSIVEVSATSSSEKSTGSGVVITSGGQIVTNNHVIAGAASIKVTFTNGKSATAKVVGADPKKDLALLQVTGSTGKLTPATLGDSSGIAVGDTVVAIGSPEGLSNTVTSGIVSALNRSVTVPVETGESDGSQWNGGSGDSGGDQWPFSFGGNQYNGDTGSQTTTYKAIQTDASLNPGNSGGALINSAGQVIGINSAMYSASSDSSSSSQAGSIGLGFAIPINTVKADLAHLRAGGDSGSSSSGSSGSTSGSSGSTGLTGGDSGGWSGGSFD
jgi:putative serine protease PepD